MSGPNPFDGGICSRPEAESEQGRRTVANWEGFDIEGRLGVGTKGPCGWPVSSRWAGSSL